MSPSEFHGRSGLRLSLVALVGLGVAGCHASSSTTGGADITVHALDAKDVISVTATISGPPLLAPRSVALSSRDDKNWGALVGSLPVGSNYVFTVSANDVNNQPIYAGVATSVAILKDQVTAVLITAQQTTAPTPFKNSPPIIDSLLVSSTAIVPGATVTAKVTGHDPNAGDTIGFAWSTNPPVGSFSASTAATTTWTAPGTEGDVTMTVTLTDDSGATTSASVRVHVSNANGTGQAAVAVSLNTWPVVTDMVAAPGYVALGQPVSLMVVASDVDNDPLTYAWTSTCVSGVFSAANASATTFTLSASDTDTSCEFDVAVSDGRGGTTSGQTVLPVGKPPLLEAPAITASVQSADSVNAGASATFVVTATDPQANAMTFAWLASGGTLSGQSDTTGGSQVTWTAPASGAITFTVSATVTDALGLNTRFDFDISVVYTSAGSLCGTAIQTSCSYAFTVQQGTQQTISVYLTNTGTAPHSATLAVVNPPAGVAFFVSPTGALATPPGATAAAAVTVDATQASVGTYDNVLLQISTDDGNVLYSTIDVTIQVPGTAPLPDLAISANDISLAASTSSSATVTVNVHNLGVVASPQAIVQLLDFGNPVGQTTLTALPPNGVGSVSFTFSTTGGGDHVIEAVVDPAGLVTESDKTDNDASTILRISTPTTLANILVTGSLPSSIYSSSFFTLSGQAIYDVLVGGVRNTSYPVKGGLVDITLVAPDGTSSIFGTVYTDTNGNFSQTLLAPALVGAHQMRMSVSDQTLSGTRQLVFNVIPLPPAPPPPGSPPAEWGPGQWNYVPSPGGSGGGSWTWSWAGGQPAVPPATVPLSDLRVVSDDIAFSKNNPAENEEITIAAQIHFWSSAPTSAATDVPINIYVTAAGSTSKVWIGKTTIASLSVGSPDYGSRVVYASWKSQGEGIYIVEVDIDPSLTFTDQVTSNNAATRAIVVGTLQTDMGTISGHITDPFGAVAGVEVDALDSTGATFASTLTDTTGTYLINQVSAGSYQLRIRPPTGETATLNPQTATVTIGAIAEVDFALALGGTGGSESDATPDGGTGGTGGSGAAGGTPLDGSSAATGGAAGGSSGSIPSTCEATNLTACGSVCVDTNSDANNCGACGAACQTGATCVSGVCTSVCPAGMTSCGNVCVNLQTSPNDCGACGNVCSSGKTCAAGTCSIATTTCVDGTMPSPTGIPVYIDVSSGIPVVSSPSSWFWSTSPYDLLHLSVAQVADGEWEIDFGFALEFSGCASGNRGVELISPATGDLVLSYGIDSFSYNNYYQEAEVYSRLWVLNSSGQLAGRTPRISNAVVPQMCLVPQIFQLAVPGIVNGGVDVYIRAQD